jgi:hypothetical protein
VKHLAAGVGAKIDHCRITSAVRAHRVVGARDREPLRREQQPVQPGDREPRGFGRLADRGPFLRDHEMRLVRERERCELEAAPTLAMTSLPRERHRDGTSLQGDSRPVALHHGHAFGAAAAQSVPRRRPEFIRCAMQTAASTALIGRVKNGVRSPSDSTRCARPCREVAEHDASTNGAIR